IYESVWKQRSQSWKLFKQRNELTKSHFINYRRDHTHNNDPGQKQRQLRRSDFRDLNTNQGYHCPFNDSRRNIDSNTLWIYLTSSNFLHNLPWLSTLDNDLSQFHSY
ncbi:3951_t:CDS:1, partial [Rhizophagus irregularis]